MMTPIRRSALAAVLVTSSLAARASAQAAHPDSARLLTGSISKFWLSIDRWAGRDSAALVAALRDNYFANPSPGLFDWMVNRLISQNAVGQVMQAHGVDRQRAMRGMTAAPGTPDRALFDTLVMPAIADNAAVNLAHEYLARRKYYDAIRPNTLAVDTARAITDSIRVAFRRLAAIYPEARFADVYFLIGRLTSGGTTGQSGLLIGTEMFGRDDSTPTDELSPWHKAVTGRISHLPHIVAHEMIHTLQGPRSSRGTLLSLALDEGSADFLAELISGEHIINPAYAFGDAHEKQLWTEFQAAMDSTNTSNWLYQGDRAPPGRPADLGYWVGYKISKAYYEHAADKRAAVKDILLFKDAKAFLAASGYAP